MSREEEEPTQSVPLLNAGDSESNEDVQLTTIRIDSKDVMTIRVRHLSGKMNEVQLPAVPSTSCLDLKTHIEEAEDIAIYNQKLIFGGRELQAGDLLMERGITDGYTVHLLVLKNVPPSHNDDPASAGGDDNLTPIGPMDHSMVQHPTRISRASILDTYALARAIRWFAGIDGMILILSASGFSVDGYQWIIAVGLIFVMCGYYGARLFKCALIVPYFLYLLASVVYRFYRLYTVDGGVYESFLLITALVIEFYIMQRVARLIVRTHPQRMSNAVRTELLSLERR